MPATPEAQPPPPSRRSSTWINANCGNVYYRTRNPAKKNPPTTRFPRPLIEPRRTRPQAIHIITYPPGYVPPELRQRHASRSSRVRSIKVRAARAKRRLGEANHPSSAAPHPSAPDPSHQNAPDRFPIRPVIGKILASFSSVSFNNLERRHSVPAVPVPPVPPVLPVLPAASPTHPRLATSPAPSNPSASDVIHQVPSAASRQSPPRRSQSVITANNNPGDDNAVSPTSYHPPPSASGALPTSTDHRSTSPIPTPHPPPRSASDAGIFPISQPPPRVRPRPQSFVGTTLPRRPNSSLMAVRMAKPAFGSPVTEIAMPKPVASGSGVSCSILLAEPNVFLSGFDHDSNTRRETRAGTALLRGKLMLSVSKNVKIKAVQLKLVGRARTEWPEGIPPLKQDVFEEQSLRTQVLTFFNAMNEGWETEYGNQCTYKLKSPSGTAKSSAPYLVMDSTPPSSAHRTALSAKDLKRLSLQSSQSRSFGKGDSAATTSTQAKGFKIFYPGRYEYSFELPIDHHQLETTKLQYGSVKWELQASVDRAGAFKPNLHGSKEVPVIRIPDQMSLEMSEPISISRQWEDQLHYDIIVSGKSFPIGGKIPIAFKLTPLAKVQVHKLKVFATESVEYWTNDRRVTRKDPGRKILLLEKSAGKPLDPAWASSELRTVRGGELTHDQRQEAREMAARRRTFDAARRHSRPEPLPAPTENLLGDLDLGLESYWGSTEIEANVQIPTCEMMAKNKEQRLHPDCSWKNVNVYHWLKIVMRISRLDPEDPTGTKRRHFEISIDSPFTVLNCRATRANTVLPAYTGNHTETQLFQSSCGCPDALTVPTETSPSSSTGTLSGTRGSNETLPSMPQAAHLAGSAVNPASEARNSTNEPRPIHLMRAPSFNPPSFDEDTAPPPMRADSGDESSVVDVPLPTPPPHYDSVIGTPSVDGLADYFSRLADYGYGNNDDDSGSDDSDETPPRILERSGRVNVAHPRTPGGRMQSRSMEITRPAINLTLDRRPNPAPTAS